MAKQNQRNARKEEKMQEIALFIFCLAGFLAIVSLFVLGFMVQIGFF